MIARKPDQASVELLQSVATTRRERTRAARAMWKLRLAIWPPVARVAVLLGVATLVLYFVMLHESDTNSPSSLLKRGAGLERRRRGAAIGTLGALANADHPMLSAPARRQVETALSQQTLAQSPRRAAALVRRCRGPAAGGRKRTRRRDRTAVHDAETRRAALDALKSLGTADAVKALRHVFEGGGGEREDLAEVNELKVAAIVAIGQIQNVWALRTLQELQSNPALPEEFSRRASEVADTIDPLVWSTYYLGRSEFDKAIAAAKYAAAQGGDKEHAEEVASALANVHAMRGLIALERDDYAAAAQDLTAAVGSGAAPAKLADAVALAQRLGFRLHEVVALQDPQA